MATTTFSQAIDNTDWVQIAAGATSASIALQSAMPGGAKIAIASSKPASDSADWFAFGESAVPLTGPIALSSGDLVFAMALGSTAIIRGYLVGA